jgi:hypothetical protein
VRAPPRSVQRGIAAKNEVGRGISMVHGFELVTAGLYLLRFNQLSYWFDDDNIAKQVELNYRREYSLHEKSREFCPFQYSNW